jgi:hypothetical protein
MPAYWERNEEKLIRNIRKKKWVDYKQKKREAKRDDKNRKVSSSR